MKIWVMKSQRKKRRMISTEFYVLSNGEVMIHELGQSPRRYRESDFLVTGDIIRILQKNYPTAFEALCTIYNKSSIDPKYYHFRMAHRFIRCNWG